jgi:hypothetical protein
MTFGQALLLTHDSFWANFGWMTLPISERWYGAIALLFAAALCGWSIRRPRETPTWAVGMMGGVLGIAFLGYVWAQLLLRESDYYQFQGRYLFPASIPLVFFIVEGLERLWPLRKSRLGVSLFLSFLVIWDAWSLAGYLLPYFYA